MVVCLHNRPPLERFRVLCDLDIYFRSRQMRCCLPFICLHQATASRASSGTYCLVFDAIFTLIFALSGLSSSAYSVETSCYEQNGYSWHNILALGLQFQPPELSHSLNAWV